MKWIKKAQIVISPDGAKHLISKALINYIDFSKRVYIAYGMTNSYFLYHLNLKPSSYLAGAVTNHHLNISQYRDKIVILDNKQQIDISEFDIDSDDYFIKGANAIWYENGEKKAAVLAADKNGGTYGNFYIKATVRGSRVIIPTTHQKLIPYFHNTSFNVYKSMGSKVSILKFFYGEVFTEIEAIKNLFELDSNIIASGGILGSDADLILEVRGREENIDDLIKFLQKYNNLKLDFDVEFKY